MSINIKNVGVYLPEKKILNLKTAKDNEYDENFINNKIGFRKLLRKEKNETLVDFCIKAYENLKRKRKNI